MKEMRLVLSWRIAWIIFALLFPESLTPVTHGSPAVLERNRSGETGCFSRLPESMGSLSMEERFPSSPALTIAQMERLLAKSMDKRSRGYMGLGIGALALGTASFFLIRGGLEADRGMGGIDQIRALLIGVPGLFVTLAAADAVRTARREIRRLRQARRGMRVRLLLRPEKGAVGVGLAVAF